MINSNYEILGSGTIKFLTQDAVGVSNSLYRVYSYKYTRLYKYEDEDGSESWYRKDPDTEFFYMLDVFNVVKRARYRCFLGVNSLEDSTVLLTYKTIGAKDMIKEKLEEKNMSLKDLNENIFVRNNDVTYIEIMLKGTEETRRFHGLTRTSITMHDEGAKVIEVDGVPEAFDNTTNLIVLGTSKTIEDMKLGNTYDYLKNNYDAIMKHVTDQCEILDTVTLEEVLGNIDKL